ncbi:MAG: PucR family transcriptional regulator, partial [Desulfocucumaceae bacterium]
IQHLSKTGAKNAFLCSPIVADTKFWGYIVVYETVELSELEMVAIEHACTVCAMDNLKQDAAIEIELRLKGDLLDDIFSMDKDKDTDLVNKAFRLGCDLLRPHRVMVVDLTCGDCKKKSNFSPELVVDIVKSGVGSLVEKIIFDSLVAVRRNRIVIILRTDETGVHANIAKLIQEWVAANIPDCSVNVTWGQQCLEFTDYRSSFEQAWQASDILESLGRKNECSGFDELGIYAILWELNNSDKIRNFAHLKIGCLLEYDSSHKSNLLKTLEIYLQKNCNLRETAAAIFVHINTLKYRLRKIKKLSGLDLADEEDRFQCQLSLRLLKTLKR